MPELEIGHVIRRAENVKIELDRGQRGGYGWRIDIYGNDPGAMVNEAKYIDQRLRELFLPKPEGEVDEGKEDTD